MSSPSAWRENLIIAALLLHQPTSERIAARIECLPIGTVIIEVCVALGVNRGQPWPTRQTQGPKNPPRLLSLVYFGGTFSGYGIVLFQPQIVHRLAAGFGMTGVIISQPATAASQAWASGTSRSEIAWPTGST